MTEAAYELVAERLYYAKVDRFRYWLPPMPGSRKPERGHAWVLRLSDAPFVDGRPGTPMTPRSQSYSF